MKKVISRISVTIFSLLLIISLFGIVKTFAMSSTFKVTNIEVKEKSDGVIVNNVSLDNDIINNDIILTDKDDYIKYNITVKNNTDKDYIIKAISDDNDSTYLEYTYDDLTNEEIKAGTSKTIELMITYKQESSEVNISTKKLNLSITYEYEEENSDNNKTDDNPANIVPKDDNPKTGDGIYKYIVLFVLSTTGLVVTIGRKKKISKPLMMIGIIGSIIIPSSIKAASDVFVITFNNNIKARQYTVTIDKDNNEENDTIKVVKRNHISQIQDPTKTGYEFVDWYLGDNIYDLDTPVLQDITIKAKWQIKSYTITFDTDGGTEIPSITQDYNTDITAPSNPTKTGYTFNKWNKNIPNKMPAENMTIKAIWDINQYTITFDTDGGTEIPSITQDYNTDITAPSNPTRTGYTFDGWNINIPNKMPAENMTIKAIWEEDPAFNFYDVTFDSNGGTEVASQRIIEGGKIVEPENPTKTNYLFNGWYLNNVAYDFDTPVTADCVLVASWKEDPSVAKYTVTFNSNGGTYTPSQTVFENEKAIEPAAPSRNDGYVFGGWFNGSVGYDFNNPVTEDIELEAYWEEDPDERWCDIDFDSDGGTPVPSQRVMHYLGRVVEPEPPTMENYKFDGWYREFLSGESVKYDFNEPVLADFTLKAHWTYDPEFEYYWVNFDTNGGDFVEDQLIKEGEKVTRPADPTTSNDEVFINWYLDDEVYDFDTPVTHDIRLVAKWGRRCGNHPIIENTYSSDEGQMEFKYSDCFFEDQPYVYNDHMATSSLNFAHASSTYKSGNDYSNGAKNIVDVLTKSGFEDIYVSDSYKVAPTDSSIGYVIASKDVSLERGNKKVISVTVRSAGYEKEWASNVTLGKTGQAFGFNSAAEQVLTGIRKYISDNNLYSEQNAGDLIFWVHGYSRGGATSNLTAKELIDFYVPLGNKVYAYCIEAPQGGLTSLNTGDYSSIHNVINVDDLVPYVAPTGMGFRRYGVDHYIFDNEHDWIAPGIGNNDSDNYPNVSASEDRLKRVDEQLQMIFKGDNKWKDYQPYTITSKHVDVPSFDLEDANRQEYTSSFLYRFIDGITKQPNGTPVLTREDYVDDGVQEALQRFMVFLNSDTDLNELMDAIGPTDLVGGGGGEAILALITTLPTSESSGEGLRLKLNNNPVARYLFAAAVRDTLAGNDEVMEILEKYPDGKVQALNDIETIVNNVLKSCDYVDDYATLVTNIKGIFANHQFVTTMGWLRSYDSWYFSRYN